MKKHFKIIFTIIAYTAIFVSFSSCYKNIGDASFPAPLIYMPSAGNGIYTVNSIAIPGQTFRYTVDLVNSKLSVPLAVYRSGINNEGDINVNIASKSDTINTLISSGALTNTVLLPTSAYSIPSAVTVDGGADIAKFNLNVDLNFLLNNVNKSYAIAVAISSPQISSTSRNLTVVVINPSFLIPAANFTYVLDATTPKQYNFTNTSVNSLSYVWNFGDGSATVTTASPTHVYASGTYTVTLTATGAAGNINPSVKPPVTIVVP